MTLNDISRKLFKNNRKQYGLFFISVVFSIAMTGAYGVLQYSPTVTNVLADGGSTQTISQAMFFGSMLGIIVFLVYADSIFLKYKSREIGIFLSLGIDRRSVQKIIVKEYTLLFQIAALLGLILSIPLAYLCWSLLNLFLETQETAFSIGWMGFINAVLFSLLNWFILQTINRRYIKNVDILKIIKASDENETAKNGNLFLLILGALLVPVGIVAFFTLQNIGGFLNTLLAFVSLAGAVSGVYLLIIQCASIGDILKKYNDKAYYKNIVFYNLLKQKIRQYTRSIFVATLLITFTVFGIGFIAAGFIDGYNVALNEPYDYTINATCEHPMTENRIEEIAEESKAAITDIKHIDCLLLGVQNNYKNGERDWGSRIIVSEDNFNALSGMTISVPKGSYTIYYDSSMEYKLNAFSADNSLFDEYRAVSYMVNVENWQDTMDFQNNILKAVISDNNGVIFTNWHNSAIFAKTGSHAEFLPFEGNETRIARVWSLYPLSKLSSTTTQFEAFATYLMLMLFIAIVAFVSAVMVISLKLISMIWDDTEVYNNLRRLGMKSQRIKELITKQMLFVSFIPAVPGCIIGAFTTYRIMLVSGVIYISKTMQLVGCVCCLVVIIQSTIFLVLREVVADKMLNTPLHLSA